MPLYTLLPLALAAPDLTIFEEETLDSFYVFGVILQEKKNQKLPTRSELGDITRAINRSFHEAPVAVIFRYGDYLAFANTERADYQQSWREGEKVGKVSLLKDICISKPHRGHLQILDDLTIERSGSKAINSFRKLYAYWQKVFDTKELNERFYKEISTWYYYAVKQIKLPVKPSYYRDDAENVKNFTVRLISRMIFCWFLKERELIDRQLLELEDFDGSLRRIFGNENNKSFYKENSYYRGILQNVFFTSLNRPINDKDRKAFFGKQYLPKGFQYDLFEKIPFLNGGLFDKLEEDNCNDRIDDKAFRVPNKLFYAEEIEVQSGKKTLKTKGLNRILASYKFTIAENTPFEEEVALDPELLGLVFENLLAELDPDENVAKSARKESGSFYTPRKVIEYMINESLFLYFKRHEKVGAFDDKQIKNLIYHDKLDTDNKSFCQSILQAVDEIKVLDPACGSGAFPMGILNRLVEILEMVDKNNALWIDAQLGKIAPELRKKMRQELEKHDLNYARKLGLIRNAIYGIDIQPLAIMISKLRFFISLLVEQEIDLSDRENNYHISALPNLETKIICANSLNDASTQLDVFKENIIEELHTARDSYYNPEISQTEKNSLVTEIAEKLNELYPYYEFAAKIAKTKPKDAATQKALNIGFLREWFKHASLPAPFFNPKVFFPEITDGFHIITGNPPYGGNKIEDNVRKALSIESKDPYGAFIARFLGDGQRPTALSYQGILSLIVSDTFMTIKSHKPLRKQMMRHYIHKMVRVHPDTFKATVNTAIIFIEKNEIQDDNGKKTLHFDAAHRCLMADLTQVSIHENYSRFLELLYKTTSEESPEEELKKVEQNVYTMKGEDWTSESSEEYALYSYSQQLISKNTNIPLFVANPKLYELLTDTNPKVKLKVNSSEVYGQTVYINNNKTSLYKLEQIADVNQGLATGDNEAYLFQNSQARGNYRSIEEYNEYILTEKDLKKIEKDEKLRNSVIDYGISVDNVNSNRFFNGRYILPYDKGGESNASEGWMPNYYVPTDYFIDWSESSVKRLKTLTTKARNKFYGRPGGDNRLCSRFQNAATYFIHAITFSPTGVYSPTFRVHYPSVYDKEGSCIFSSEANLYYLIATLTSKLSKYFQKNHINTTVHSMQGDLNEAPIALMYDTSSIVTLVEEIVRKQKENPYYDYASHEQLEIDLLTYNAYGLNDYDIKEVENWYARRYSKLVAAQKENLRRLGKSTDYLEIYRALREQKKVPH